MAAMSTVVKELSQNGSNITYAMTSWHSAVQPHLLITKVKPAKGAKGTHQVDVIASAGVLDAAGAPLNTRASFTLTCRFPVDLVDGVSNSNLGIVLDVMKDFLNSDQAVPLLFNGYRVDA